jgi:hypothetical protein
LIERDMNFRIFPPARSEEHGVEPTARAGVSWITKTDAIDVGSCSHGAASLDRDILRVHRLARTGLSLTLAANLAALAFGEAGS